MKVDRICEWCSRQFKAKPWEVANGLRRFCSNKCSAISRYPPMIERFWSKVDRRGPDECWEWTAYRSEDNYGILQQKKAHRVSWELNNGPIPAGLLVCHRCDNPPCVNPSHLFIGTNNDNTQDRIRKGRSRHLYGELHKSVSKLTDAKVLEIRRLYSEDGIKVSQLAKLYSPLNISTVYQIINRKTWKHLQ